MGMRPLALIVATAAIVGIAIAAFAFGPANVAKLGTPTGGTNPQAASIAKPTWHVGDSWTYNVSSSQWDPLVASPVWGERSIFGTLTRTVTSADESQYNVSVHGSFHLDDVFEMDRDGGFSNGSTMVLVRPFLENATVDGYVLYRASDLAEIKEVRTVHLTGSIWTEHGSFDASFTATVQTTFDPPLDVWAFPLRENATWNASSNATIHARTEWRLVGPNESFGFWHTFNATVPIALEFRSGELQNVSTPAGKFSAIPVRVGIAEIERMTAEDREGPVMGLGADECGRPRLAAEAFFSGDVGNVVKAVAFVRGMKIVVELTSFHHAA
jgi:hypothetical protein